MNAKGITFLKPLPDLTRNQNNFQANFFEWKRACRIRAERHTICAAPRHTNAQQHICHVASQRNVPRRYRRSASDETKKSSSRIWVFHFGETFETRKNWRKLFSLASNHRKDFHQIFGLHSLLRVRTFLHFIILVAFKE